MISHGWVARLAVWAMLTMFLPGNLPGAEPQPANPVPAKSASENSASTNSALRAYQSGFALQKEMRTLEAIEAYQKALRIDPFLGKAHYEIGWSYWVLRDWEQVVRHWEVATQLKAGPPEFPEFLAMARERLSGKIPPLVRVPIGVGSKNLAGMLSKSGEGSTGKPSGKSSGKSQAPAGAAPGAGAGKSPSPLLRLVARIQNYDPSPAHPRDRFDRHVFSPKSVLFSPSGSTAYVNALEGHTTLVYDTETLQRKSIIRHRFGKQSASLFDRVADDPYWRQVQGAEMPVHPNRFRGKPVEALFSHGGRFLWVSYYRRSYDAQGRLPSAVAVVDTAAARVVRVMHTGPIPKMLAVSPSGQWLAVVHWGDNTVGLIQIGANEPGGFRHAGLIVVGRKLPQIMGKEVDRDHYCGYCLRGAVFTADGRYLLVARMGGGGIAVLDVEKRLHMGTVWGMKPTPRHLILSPDGKRLYLSSSASGYVSVYRVADLLAAARGGRRTLPPLHQTRTGRGTRTIALAPGGQTLFAAVNSLSRVVAMEAQGLGRLLEIPADSFPVGLAVSPNGKHLWVTSQGIKLRGGNAISIYRIGGE